MAQMTITVDIRPEVRAELARQAAANGMEIDAYAASLLEAAVHLPAGQPQVCELKDQTAQAKCPRPAGRKSLMELFAESPFKGLDLDFERDPDTGRDVEL
jgi:hypothetical protein